MSGIALSVLTLVKQRRSHLLALIEGLARCEPLPGELVIVVMDDDGFDPPATPFPIRVIHLPADGLPLATARNQAAAAARFPALLFLDVDCIPMRGLVGAMAHHIDRHDALIGAEVHYLPADAPTTPWDETRLVRLATTHPARVFPHAGVVEAPQPGLFWSLAFGVRRARFEALGGFDERFTGYGAEDTDLAFRAARAGVATLFGGGSGALHQHHANFNPPLHHFEDILRNARVFHAIWGVWPMTGWLDQFEALGLIERTPTRLIPRRTPTPTEIAHARQPDTVAFG